MDMGFHKARRDQAATEIDRLALGGETRFDRRDLPADNTDIGQLLLGTHTARASQNEIHRLPNSLARRLCPVTGRPGIN